MTPSTEALHVLVHGRVQGVGFRVFVLERAKKLGLHGWVRNLPDGDVEAFGIGTRSNLENWLSQLQIGPTLARVEKVQTFWSLSSENASDFLIVS